MKVIIAGAGRLGQEVAAALGEADQDVTVIDINDELVDRLSRELSTPVLHGDACEPTVLEAAGALKADVLVAATGEDEDNLVICLLAKRYFDVPRVVARVNDPENQWLFDARWGVDVSVSGSSTLLSLIEEATVSADTVGLMRLATAGVSVIETTLTPRSASVGRALSEIRLPPGSVVATVVRHGEPSVPRGSFRLQAGDELLIVSESATEADVRAIFQQQH